MNRWLILGVGGVLTISMVVFLAIGLTNDPRSINSPLIGKPAPPFALQDLSGQTLSLEDLRGKTVLVNFWATWCVPCISEHEAFREAKSMLGDRLEMVGVVYQDDTERVRQLQAERGTWGRTLLDPGSKMAIAYGVYGVPESYLIGADGVIIDKIAAPLMTANHVYGWLDQHKLLR